MESPPYQPLSAQDASFLFFEHRATHMHVAALAIFEVGPLRSGTGGADAARLARYGESQLGKLPSYRQKLAFAPLSGRPDVPGPQSPLYVLGARLLELYPMPPLFERQGVGTAVMSYDGRLCWCILADRDVVPDLGALARDVDEAFHELRGAAGR